MSLRLHFLVVFEIFFFITSSKCDEINDDLWEARLNTGGVYFPPYQTERMSLQLKYINHPPEKVPESFDSRLKWPFCKIIGRIIDQGKCGYSWAVVLATILNDRLCIRSKGKEQFEHSPEHILTCCDYCTEDKTKDRCKSRGSPVHALKYASSKGVVSGGNRGDKGCKPISSKITKKGQSPSCAQNCTNPKFRRSYSADLKISSSEFAIIYNVTTPTSVKQIQIEIMRNGPVMGFISPTLNFGFNYTDEVYTSPETGKIWHGVKILGWGALNNSPYWLVANSWGVQWGKLDGFFKMSKYRDVMGFSQHEVIAPQTGSAVLLVGCVFWITVAGLFHFCFWYN